jgi:hypothetical protein
MGPVEVIASVENRRHWSEAQQQAIVEEAEEPGSNGRSRLGIEI